VLGTRRTEDYGGGKVETEPMPKAPDPVTRNLWYVVAATDELSPGVVDTTMLLDTRLAMTRALDGEPVVWLRTDEEKGDEIDAETILDRLPVKNAYGYAWTCLGTPDADLFPIPEFAEPDRKNMSCGSIGIHVSAPRAVENFLDMGHFPYVHTDILGSEPHTEVKEYDVEVSEERDEVLATRCRFIQPRAAKSATSAMEVEYIYRVPHPFCSVLYKSCPEDESRQDVIGLFLPAHDRGNLPRPSPAIDDRLLFDHQGHAPFPADHFRPGQADPRKPISQETAARPARRNPDPRRQERHRLSEMAEPEGDYLWGYSPSELRIPEPSALSPPSP
jgi:hypothetical protein